MTFLPEWARGLCAGDADDAALALATEVGGWPELARAERRAFALLVLAVLDARDEGATRLRLDALDTRLVRRGANGEDRARAVRLGAELRAVPVAAALAPLAPFFGRPGDYRPFILDGDHLYDERTLRLEHRLASALSSRLGARERPSEPAEMRAAISSSADPGGRRWTTAQAAAIEAAMRRPLTVISGGPGTGKTALIGGIVRGWAALGISPDEIAIAAPTGRAANRIAELMPPGGPTASTVHRLLGYAARGASTRAGAFRHHENRPLPYAAVVVDEASMLGLALTEQLVRALRPDARLCLVGDADQLPAVDAGGVFRDLGAFALRLRESHRMDPADPAGAAVLEAAQAIARGELGPRGTPPARRPAELPGSGFACLDPGDGGGATRRMLGAFVEHWYATHLRADAGLALDDDAAIAAALDRHGRRRLLTVTRSGFAGARRINDALARRFAADAGAAADTGTLAPGTPVLMTHNDYDRGLYNGDQGMVVGGGGTAPSAVVFRRGDALARFPLASLAGALEIAYASTVHKAQGSELDHAALVLPEDDVPLSTRELVYTAVTRVRRSIVVVGRRALLDQAIARPLERSSGLADRLAAATSDTPPT